MLSDRQKEMLGIAIQGVKQQRAAQQQSAQAQQADHQKTVMQMRHDRSQALLQAVTKPQPAGGSKSNTASKSKQGTVPQSAITPYLTSSDLLDTSNMVAGAENTDREARQSFQNVAADALRAHGDIERTRVAGVAGANDDAAARGVYDSGIRAGNVGMANTNAARGQQGVRDTLALAAQQQAQVRAAARTQLAQQLGIMTQRAAENGMALPVDPYAQSPDQGSNVKGARTVRKAGARRARAGLRPASAGKALL